MMYGTIRVIFFLQNLAGNCTVSTVSTKNTKPENF